MAVNVTVVAAQPGSTPPAQAVTVPVPNGTKWSVDQQNRLVVNDAQGNVVAQFATWVYVLVG